MKTHRTLSPRQEALAERNLCVAIAALQTPDEVRAFFRDLCTPAEIQAMADRWAVVDHLNRGLPYREIHRLTGVSVTTIGRVARFLGRGNGGYEVAAQRLEQAKREPAPKRADGGRSAAVPNGSAAAPVSSAADGTRDRPRNGAEGGRHG
jgi:TrpR-related protein YerC/YecD